MRISDVMTPDVRAIAPDRTVRDAARLMDELNVGVLPVCLDGRLLGIITDRDITVRSTAVGAAPGEQAVQEIMTSDLTSCVPDDDTGSPRSSSTTSVPVISMSACPTFSSGWGTSRAWARAGPCSSGTRSAGPW